MTKSVRALYGAGLGMLSGGITLAVTQSEAIALIVGAVVAFLVWFGEFILKVIAKVWDEVISIVDDLS